MSDYIIAPSILSADFSRLGDEIRAVEKAGADWIHVDVMDGHFVPNITIGPLICAAARQVTTLPLDVHLMIENVDTYIPMFAEAGADIISVHVETGYHLHRSVQLIKSLGKKAGIVLNPATPVSLAEPILPFVDLVLMMTVNPGFGGQSFIEGSLERIAEMSDLIKRKGLDVIVEADGGVGPSNIADVAKAGCRAFVAGSAIYKTDDYAATIKTMRDELATVG
ncbi:MAG: ribulose-phosphate 3-epimerase [Deltaproteobacteria bacterium]|nr:ribulose-phosphate 3-epimerase [Deltaproteobacteria bacterium]